MGKHLEGDENLDLNKYDAEYHPMALAKEKAWDFADGSKVWIEAAPGKSLTVCETIYMLDDIKYRIHKMMYSNN